MKLKIEVVDYCIFFLGKATIKDLEHLKVPTLKSGIYTIDFNKLETVDSAFIAWLLDWQKNMFKQGAIFKYSKLPTQFKDVITAYKVQSLFTEN